MIIFSAALFSDSNPAITSWFSVMTSIIVVISGTERWGRKQHLTNACHHNQVTMYSVIKDWELHFRAIMETG